MTTTLLTELTVANICDGFVYNELEGKGLFGWGGKLVIQPEYQRNYIYADGKKDVAVVDASGMQRNFNGLDGALQRKILDSKLTVYVCEGEEPEIKAWFKTINIAGVPLNEQELLNAIYSGPFVTAAKEVFSNSSNANQQKWRSYVRGNEKRQDILRTALDWVSQGDIDGYMSRHRPDADIRELKTYFETVIDWANRVRRKRSRFADGTAFRS